MFVAPPASATGKKKAPIKAACGAMDSSTARGGKSREPLLMRAAVGPCASPAARAQRPQSAQLPSAYEAPSETAELERGDNRARIVAQEILGQLGVLQSRTSITTNCEKGMTNGFAFGFQQWRARRAVPPRHRPL